MADLVISVSIDAKDTKNGADEAKRAVRGIGDEAEKSAKKTSSLAKVDYSEAIKQLKEYGSRIKDVGDKISGVGQKLSIGLTAPILALALLIGGLGTTYESALNTFQAVTKASADEMRQASQVAKQLGADVTLPATSAKDAALAMAELGKAGFNAAQSMAAAKGVLQLAAAGQLDEAKAAEITANALNSFSLKAEDAVRVADLLAAASNASSAEVTDVAESYQQASASFAAAKIPIEDLTTAIAIMANAGIKGSDAGTSLKTFLSSIQAPSKAGADTLKELGVTVFDLQGKMKSLPDIIGQFDQSLSKLTDEQKVQAIQKIFGSDASRAAQILFRDGEAGFEKIKEAVTQTGAAAELAAAKTKGVGGAFESLKSQAETIGITIYDALKGPAEQGLRALADGLGKVSDYLSNLGESNPQIIQMAAIFLAVVAAVGPLLVVLGTLVTFLGSVVSAVGTLLPIFGVIGGAFTSLGGFIIGFIGLIGEAGLVASFSSLATVLGSIVVGAISSFLTALAPVAVGVAAVVAVIGVLIGVGVALFAAYQSNFGGLRDLVNDVFNSIVATVQSGLQAVQDFWNTYGDQIITTATDTFNQVIEFIRPIMTEIVSTIREGWQTVLEVVGPLITEIVTFVRTQLQVMAIGVKAVLGFIMQFWSAHGEQIKTIVSAVWTILKTIVMTGIRQIANIITLILAVINGDWRQAWSSLKSILQTGIQASVTIMKSFGTLVITALAYVATELYNIGKNIIQGLINGIKSGAAAVYSEAKEIASSVIGIFRSVPKVQSPSRVTTEIGQYIAEGLAVGMENKESRVIAAAKKIATEVIKQFQDAQKEFSKLAGASPETVRTIQQTNQFKDATGDQQEIIKLRGELQLNNYKSLPTDLPGTQAELRYLREQKKAQDDLNQSIENMNKTVLDSQDAIEKANEAFAEKLDTMRASGEIELLNLQKEVSLVGVTDTIERQRIENYYEMLRLRQQMESDGYGQQQIDEAAAILQVQQAQQAELKRILEIRNQVTAGEGLEKSLLGDLAKLQNGNAELSVYEQTLQKINTDLKDISPEQKEQILNVARQIDAQKQFNDQYKETYDFIRGTLDTLTDSGKSFGDKMKSIFGGVVDHFKKMLLDMLAAYLTSKISKLFGANGSGSGSSGGGLLDLFKNIFNPSGSGVGGTPSFNPTSFTGGSSSYFSGTGSFGILGNAAHDALHATGNSSGSSAAGGGFFGGGINGTIGGIAGLATIGGGLIGGTAGNFIQSIGSGALTGLALGAKIGAIGGPIGAAIGAGAGVLLGLFSLFSNRSKDKKENLPQLHQGFDAAFEQLKLLAADKNSFNSDPDGAISKALEIRTQIASGFGVSFLSNKYKKQAQSEIDAKLREADILINQMKAQRDTAKVAGDIDQRLDTSFATGVYMDWAFLKQYSDYKRRNGMLAGQFTGVDTLPSMLAQGEMVLNPAQIEQVKRNAGFDAFKGAGIPNYATGTYLPPSPQSGAISTSASALAGNNSAPPLNVTVVIEGEGISNAKIKDVIIDGFENDRNIQTSLVKNYDKTKSLRKD